MCSHKVNNVAKKLLQSLSIDKCKKFSLYAVFAPTNRRLFYYSANLFNVCVYDFNIQKQSRPNIPEIHKVTRITCLVLFTASMNDTCHKQITQYLIFMVYTILKQFWEDCNWTSLVSLLLRNYKIMSMKNKSITNSQVSITVKKTLPFVMWCHGV
jgi:hypothetical protein